MLFRMINSVADGKIITIALFMTIAVLLSIMPALASDGLTPEQVAELKWINSAAIAPSGNRIAYCLHVPRNPFTDGNGKGFSELHVCDLNGTSRPYVTGDVSIGSIAFTPDGENISYLAKRDDDAFKSLYLIPVDGGESRKIIEVGADISGYVWAPDSRWVAFLACEKLTDDIENLRDLGFTQEIYEEDWRPVRVWLYDTESPDTPPRLLDLPGSASSLHWSPDGAYLLLALAPTPLIDDRYMARKITLVDAATGEIVRTYPNEGKIGAMAFSPDGSRFAAITAVDINDPKEGQLVLGSVANTDLRQLVASDDRHVRRVGWLDDETIVYLYDLGTEAGISAVPAEGGAPIKLLPPSSPVFQDMYVSVNGATAALIGSAFDHPWELFALNTDTRIVSRLTDVNPWLADIAFAKQEVIDFKAKDGLALQGILIHPLEEVKGQGYPLIMVVHGGPEAHDKNGWLTSYAWPGQVAAARGFAVFYPNYRGSTGRGLKFSKMGQEDYAGKEFTDLVDAKKHLVKMGLVNDKKVGITGRSYGGYATAWAATKLTKEFAAGVMGAGVSDLISKFGTTDIPNEMYLVHARQWPWDNWDWFMDRSPIHHAEKSRTPLLILHGKEDTRVHTSQALEMYRYLKTVDNVPVRLVLYPGEKHGTSNAAARYDANLRLMRWMEYYLKGPGGEPPTYELDYSPLNPTGAH